MENYLNYIIESGISLGVFTLVYWFVLRNETMLKAGRVYLIGALLFSTVLPFITINYVSQPAEKPTVEALGVTNQDTNLLETVTVFASGLPAKVGQQFMSFSPSLWFYKFGAIAALALMITGLVQLLIMFFHNRVFKLKGARLILTQKNISPYSFFNLIFINAELPSHKNWKAMVHHELEHARQGHSFDVLFIDFMMVFQWFNPFYWVIRHLVRENHEFLADRAVLLHNGITAGHYKALLLTQVIGGKPIITSNFFNVHTIKNRFKMISKNKTGKLSFLKYASGFVVALAVTLMFACEKNIQTEPAEVFNAEKQIVFREQIVDIGDIAQFEVKELMLARIPVSDLLAEMPNLKVQLPTEGEVMVMFDCANEQDVKIAERLNVKVRNKSLVANSQFANTLPDDVFVIVEEMPEFNGGEKALRAHLAEQIQYPADALKRGIQGRVYVQFVVGASGEILNARIARGIDPVLDAEAIRVVSEMPTWTPGKQRGVPVKVSYTVPINFSMQ